MESAGSRDQQHHNPEAGWTGNSDNKKTHKPDNICAPLNINTFNAFGVVESCKPNIHRFHRRLFIFKSFGLGSDMKDTAPNRIKLIYEKTAAGEQSEAITTHQIVTSVLISPLAQAAESHGPTSSFTNITKQPSQRKSVFPLDEIGVISNTFCIMK